MVDEHGAISRLQDSRCNEDLVKEVKMTKELPDGFGSDTFLDRQAAIMMGDEEAIRADQRAIDIKWFNQWLEEVVASGKVKCPDCAWNLFQGAEHIGMTPCNHCNSTGFITESLRMEEK